MGNKTPPFLHHPEWTTARYFGFLRSGLRKMYSRYPVKYNALKAACEDVDTGVEYKSGPRKGEPKTIKMYKCASCDHMFKATNVQVDHIKPAGTLKTHEDLLTFVPNLFCGLEGLQVLCTDCHDAKTKKERSSK